MQSATQEETAGQPLEVDDKCDVKWRDREQCLPAVVIERRPLNYRKRRKKDPTPPGLDTLKADEIEYYVHYEKQDR
jgi:hypothetical protein